MKRTLSMLAIIFFVVVGTNLKAQTAYKFGHIKSSELMETLPESAAARTAIEAEQKSLRDQLEIMDVEARNKYNDFLTNEKLPVGDPKRWSDIIKADKEKEIQGLSQRIQEFQQTASEQLQKKQDELYKPIIDRITAAIKAVAKENKFTYIFEASSLLYFSEESIDITTMVKAKLAVK